MPEDQPLTDGCISDAALPVPMAVRATEAHCEHLEQDLALTRLSHRDIDAFQGARAGQPDGRGGGWAQLIVRAVQEAKSTPGLTTSISFSMVSRS